MRPLRFDASLSRTSAWVKWAALGPLGPLLWSCMNVAEGAKPLTVAQHGSAIEAEIGSAACTSAAQCRTLAVGSKACGGPQRYVAWSTGVSDEGKLKALAEAHRAAMKADNERSERLSNCALVQDPGAYCSPAGRCDINPGGSRGVRNSTNF